MKQHNKNFLFNTVYQLLTYVFPLITIPYVSRVLGVEQIGIYSYTYSIVYAFMLVAKLGIDKYGNREVARVRENSEELSKTFSSIYGLQIILGLAVVFVYVIYAALCREYSNISRLQVIFLLSACIDVSWFYFGLEKFKMTISRNLIIKVGSILMVFLLVKQASDLWKYTMIMAGATFISQLYLFINLPRYVRIRKVSFKDIYFHFHNVILLFVPVLAFGIYRVMDKTMIGAMASVTELGYYENAERLINVPCSVINALGTVMLPRMAHMAKYDKSGLLDTIKESMNLALVLAVMMTGGLILIAKDAALVIFGSEFVKSGDIILMLASTIIAAAWANVIRTQYLIPNRLDKIYVKSTVWGALLNLFCNIIFIPNLGAYGACIGTICAEYMIMVYQCVATKKVLPQEIFLKQLAQALWKTIIIICIVYVATVWINDLMIRLVAKVAAASILFVALNREFVLNFMGIRRR